MQISFQGIDCGQEETIEQFVVVVECKYLFNNNCCCFLFLFCFCGEEEPVEHLSWSCKATVLSESSAADTQCKDTCTVLQHDMKKVLT